MTCELNFSNQFVKLYGLKEKRSPKELIRKVDEGIVKLKNSEIPEALGIRKKGELKKHYSYEITRGHRILYRVVRKNGTVTINFCRVCDHKNVYGKD